MLRAREPRYLSNLPVWVSGRDLNGNRFKQSATVSDVSRHGGRLSGIRCLREPGEVIEVEHRGQKAEFRVVWIDLVSGHVGICSLEAAQHLWGTAFPVGSAASAMAAGAAPGQTSPPATPSESRGSELRSSGSSSLAVPADANPSALEREHSAQPATVARRRYPRFRCSGGVTAHAPNNRIWGTLSVIGLGGCYIDTAAPFRVSTRIDLLIGAHGIELRIQGEVRCSHPGVGMGIMFTELSELQSGELGRLVVIAAERQRQRY